MKFWEDIQGDREYLKQKMFGIMLFLTDVGNKVFSEF